MYEFGRGVRIFENIAGVRIRTLVYEKKNSAVSDDMMTSPKAIPHRKIIIMWLPRGPAFVFAT